ncbi:MAG: DUF6428 family protein [bacterium]
MTSNDFVQALEDSPLLTLRFVLPDGGLIPEHAHITEVGRVDKTFLDCGGTLRKLSSFCLQAWVADDTDHRLNAGKLVDILKRALPLLGGEDLNVELEYEDGIVSQFPVQSVSASGDSMFILLGTKHTDCLAKDICLPPAKNVDGCSPGSGCC